MTTRKRDFTTLAERCRAVGFLVTKTKNGYRVLGPEGQTVGFHLTAEDSRAYATTLRNLNRMGLEEREAKIAAKAERDRKTTIAADRAKGDAKAAIVAKTSRADETWIFAVHSFPAVRLITVTPELAERMLERCTRNRPRKKEHIRGLSIAMEDDRFVLTHQGVAFDSNGEYIDGQHRLQAIIDSGRPQLLWVFVGIDPRAVDFIDTHVKRTGADTLSMGGRAVKNAPAVASLVKFVYTFDHCEPSMWAHFRVDNELIRKEHEANAEAYQTAVREARTAVQAWPGYTATHFAAVLYLARRAGASEAAIETFLHGYKTGEDLGSGHPLLALRREARHYRDGHTVPRRVAFAQVLLTWNAVSKGQKLVAFSWKLDDAMPPIAVRK